MEWRVERDANMDENKMMKMDNDGLGSLEHVLEAYLCYGCRYTSGYDTLCGGMGTHGIVKSPGT